MGWMCEDPGFEKSRRGVLVLLVLGRVGERNLRKSTGGLAAASLAYTKFGRNSSRKRQLAISFNVELGATRGAIPGRWTPHLLQCGAGHHRRRKRSRSRAALLSEETTVFGTRLGATGASPLPGGRVVPQSRCAEVPRMHRISNVFWDSGCLDVCFCFPRRVASARLNTYCRCRNGRIVSPVKTLDRK